MTMQNPDQIRDAVRTHYSAIARGEQRGCCGATPSDRLGYSADELAAVPVGADLGLGCGNPQAIAQLRAGEVVIDLGAGGGFDALLAARSVGPSGRVIGVDASADMIALARRNAERQGAAHCEFRLGEIEHLPVADASVDVVMSNCVINLSPDKPAVYRDAFRVLKAGGRLAISDVVALRPLPAAIAGDVAALCGCIAGAADAGELGLLLRAIGFTDVAVEIDPASREVIDGWAPGSDAGSYVASARITAVKPGACCAPGCCA
jgi:arsenite methyltransferase